MDRHKLMDEKNHHVYSGKFALNVLDLNRADLATDEDRMWKLVHRFLIPPIPSTRYLHHCRVVVSQRCHRIASFLRLALIQISSTLYTRIKKTVY